MICAQVLLGNTPIFWMVEYSYVSVILGVSLGTFFLWPRLSAKFGLTIDGEFVFWADTIGLAAAVVAGAAIGEANHERVTVFASAIAGTSTGCFGGIFRDVFLQKPVRIMNSYLEIYASPCFLGALATALIIRLCPSQHLCGNQPVRRVRIEQASRRWRGGRPDDSARTRRKILIFTQASTTLHCSWASLS